MTPKEGRTVSSNHYCSLKHELLEEGLSSLPDVPAPAGFTAALLSRLPRGPARQTRFQRWRTFGATAALMLLLGSPLYILTAGARPMVESTDPQAGIELEGRTVTLRAGEVLRGDLRVYNAELRVQGRIEGAVYLAASTLSIDPPGEVVGEVRVLPQSWLMRLRFGLVEMGLEVRSFVRGALR